MNIMLGLFSSSFLVLIVSLLAYFHEKKKYYLLVLDDIRGVLFSCLAIINVLKNRDSSISTAVLYGQITSKLGSVKALMLEYEYFIRRNEKDKIIDSSLVEVIRFQGLYDIILEKTIVYQRNEVSLKEYEIWFNNISKELIGFESIINSCQELLLNNSKSLIKDRKLESVFDK
ncbi:hypothetical protein [Paenibacillus radicis (ex Gao et al. 2016)]|uniref:hypothetical protein n=1 Tax=Paenibacillus radicis (ex Gao et al. 2016) TaxID=1737354 RepID=UPI00166906D6|nr:hypothetical protein [Paenibacillus radicis (ex Gao et al. 2016)]